MIYGPMSEGERATIADLEVFGLSVPTINALDDQGFLYVDQVAGLDREELQGRNRRMGPTRFDELQRALENARHGTPVKTPAQCLEMGDGRVNSGRRPEH